VAAPHGASLPTIACGLTGSFLPVTVARARPGTLRTLLAMVLVRHGGSPFDAYGTGRSGAALAAWLH
jgi:hypothetical protein